MEERKHPISLDDFDEKDNEPFDLLATEPERAQFKENLYLINNHQPTDNMIFLSGFFMFSNWRGSVFKDFCMSQPQQI